MTDNTMQDQRDSSYLFGANASYLEELYENYLRDPQSVELEWRNYFASFAKNAVQDISHEEIRKFFQNLPKQQLVKQEISDDVEYERKQAQVLKLIDAYRRYGHFHADVDPLDLMAERYVPELTLSYYGLATELNTVFAADGLLATPTSLQEILKVLQTIYCSKTGYEYEYMTDHHEVEWFRRHVETNRGQFILSPATKRQILEKLIEAEGLERYLGSKYVGQTRFSLEGGDSLIPMLDELIQRANQQGVQEIVLGMAHRGRLNVLINTMGKSPTEICQGFEGKVDNHEGSGDVKYHLGFASNIETAHGVMHLALAFNPSHLEIINPVLEGSVRARQHRRGSDGRNQVIPVIIHGDAAIAGQGVVMETFALSQTRGFTTGGTVHIVINNQIGFTISDPQDARSSWYATDVAKMVEAPVIHVNGDDPDAVIHAIQIALDFRMQFNKDVLVDLVCYRRLGHNEGDEPLATQPVMYQKIKQHPTPLKIYAEKLINEGVVTAEEVDMQIQRYRELLDKGREIVVTSKDRGQYTVNWKPYFDKDWHVTADTGVSVERLKTIALILEKLPANMQLQPQVARVMADRHKMTMGEIAVDWGYAEIMAYATLLNEGYSIRMSGQDCRRGTFFHRHAVLHDFQTDEIYTPLDQVAEKSSFTIYDSLLSEEAVLGFEYGFASSSPETLVIWEAQYGDFVNGAQVIIDQFISSAEQKWGKRLCGLTMLLPHGYEGAGPEHSSARLERFLQLCAEQNMQVCVPSNAAQIFHLLRRQLLRPYRKPLIVMTPKSMLRMDLAKSSLKDLAEGHFQLIIPEIDDIKPDKVKRVVLCSGKVYYELLKQRRDNKQDDVALIRIEQLYPFPQQELTAILQLYKKTKDVVWCQEEPQNQGAWYCSQHHFLECLAKGQTLRYVGRPASAAPAVGSKQLHVKQQKALIDEALA